MSGFFVTGGTMKPDAPSYVHRAADEELYNALLAGEYCSVLTTRQMGKSSLMARTAVRLRVEGFRCATVDLQGKGHTNSPPEQWYKSVIKEIASGLQLSENWADWWRKQEDLLPAQRMTDFFTDLVLQQISGRVAVFIDEVDWMIRLPFSDEFFAAIRSCYNRRATDSKFDRLNFVLLGSAAPSQFIKDRTRTPFNIGRGVELTDFTQEEAQILAQPLGRDGEAILSRILYWTDGHPYLTQILLAKVAERREQEENEREENRQKLIVDAQAAKPAAAFFWTHAESSPEHKNGAYSNHAELVDCIVRRELLTIHARQQENNLKFVADRLTQGKRKVLVLYREVLHGKQVRDVSASAVHTALRLTGVVKPDLERCLRVRNRIYASAFDPKWVNEEMPVNIPLLVKWGAAAVLVAASLSLWYVATNVLFLFPLKTVLRLEGSTTVGDLLAPELLKTFLATQGAKDIEEVPPSGDQKEHRDVRAKFPGQWRPVLFSVVANGSGNSFKALAAGTADIGMSSRPIKDDEVRALAKLGDMRSPACESIVGLDGIAVIVNRNNQLPPLTRDQVALIFGGRITNWSQVGGRPGQIHLYGRRSDSGTFDTFVSLVLSGRKEAFARSLTVEPNGDETAREVSTDINGVGYVALAQIGGTTPLAISGGPGTTPLVPSPFTIATEDYVLAHRLFLYTPSSPTEFARKFVNFALSDEGQRVVKQVGFVEQTPRFEQVPIPPQAPPKYRDRVAGLRRVGVNFRFRPGSTFLDNKALADIPRLVNALSENGRRDVQVLGFADGRGRPDDNQRLSEARARVVADTLRTYGITVGESGFSSAIPVGDNSTEEGREKNRRVEVWAR